MQKGSQTACSDCPLGKKEIRVSLKYTDLNGKEDRPRTSCDGLRSSHSKLGFPGGASGKELVCQCRRHKKFGFDLWVRKILWRRAWQHTPSSILAWRIPWTSEPGGLQSIGLQSWTGPKGLSTHPKLGNRHCLFI